MSAGIHMHTMLINMGSQTNRCIIGPNNSMNMEFDYFQFQGISFTVWTAVREVFLVVTICAERKFPTSSFLCCLHVSLEQYSSDNIRPQPTCYNKQALEYP